MRSSAPKVLLMFKFRELNGTAYVSVRLPKPTRLSVGPCILTISTPQVALLVRRLCRRLVACFYRPRMMRAGCFLLRGARLRTVQPLCGGSVGAKKRSRRGERCTGGSRALSFCGSIAGALAYRAAGCSMLENLFIYFVFGGHR